MFTKIHEFSASTRTAAEAAAQIGCELGQIAKSIIFKNETTDEPVLIIACGENRIDTGIIEKELGQKISKADADYCREKTGFVIGGIPPYGHIKPINTFIDEDLFRYDQIWAAAGKPNAVFPLTPEELAERTLGKIIKIK